MPVTSPDNIYFSDTTTTMDPNAISAAQATSVQAALALRQRFEFVWANAAARTAQTGMVTGATGYQVDTKSEYIYESATWRLKLSYAEYNMASGFSIPNATFTAPTTMTQNVSTTTDSTFTSMTSGILNLSQPGIYSFSFISGWPAGPGFLDLTTDSAHLQIVGLGGIAFSAAQAVTPFFRSATANQKIYLWFYQESGSTQVTNKQTNFYVGRLG